MKSFDLYELIPGLPGELGLECMTRLPYTAHRVTSVVCRRWRQLFESIDFYYHRMKSGHTHEVACLVQAFNGVNFPAGEKSRNSPTCVITVFDAVNRTWDRLDPVPKYPNGLPLFCQLASCEGKLVVMGGWDPASYDPVTDVFVYDFTTRRWRKGKDMPSKRSFFAIGALTGRVYVAGGHDENKNALRTAWVYDLRSEEWTELGELSQERDECEGVAIGEEFWVVSGYGTDRQGLFEGSGEVYDTGSGQWRRVEGIWEEGRCPRSSVGGTIGKDGRLVCWANLDPAVRAMACGVMLGGRVLVTGSEYQGAPQAMYMMAEEEEEEEKKNRKLERVHVPNEFAGFVQSGCSVEI
ncbi:hypothetical protein K2173_010842 [Erythroxylum novogranatense]|uniref:F-box domain-containing protein n=1 Tax=Erythroxylum novogranatense TaxID=1862640 RepID=A0AAV8SZU2_9ROSI|nr:hypothetical protein K2173_010842 [Erythroxylum novogranatense]